MRLLFSRLFCISIILFSASIFSQTEHNPIQLIQAFIEANNQHDVDAMVALTTTDVLWVNIDQDGFYTEAENQAQLRDAMTLFFTQVPSSQSQVSDLNAAGPFVTFVEKASWKENDEEKSQCALAVYQLQGHLIKNAWYHEPYDC